MSDKHMYNSEQYMESLISLLKSEFASRLRYVGLQGSYERNEATSESDIDPMVIIENLSQKDLYAYRRIIESLEMPEKSCGFLCDFDTLAHWNALEVFSLVQSTRDYYGTLSTMVPAYTGNDIRAYALMLHEITHRFVHAPLEKSASRLASLEKGVFFMLQNVVYLEKGIFPKSRKALSDHLSETDKPLWSTLTALKNGAAIPFGDAFTVIFTSLNSIIRRL